MKEKTLQHTGLIKAQSRSARETMKIFFEKIGISCFVGPEEEVNGDIKVSKLF